MMVRHHLGRSGIFCAIGLVAWIVWVLISVSTGQFEVELSSAYLITPIVLVLGGISGAFLRRAWRRGELILLLIFLVLVTAISIPIYANASAAVGGLLLALAGVAGLDLREGIRTEEASRLQSRVLDDPHRALEPLAVLLLMFGAGLYLVIDSQAAIVLTVPVAMAAVLAIWKRNGPPRWIMVGLGLAISAPAGLAVIGLGSREAWPSWLSASGSLSGARHALWSDALSLWATEPAFGSGPGSFTPSSELASSTPSLAAVHSLILQVGAELGIVGVVLLAAIFLGGLLFAARGSRAVALIGIAAWTALAVHSSIDHLEDFPIVGFMGGVILGWSGFSSDPSQGHDPPLSTASSK